jgi:S-adenosylmethionine:tRNA ribosyltransferase-isomerase
VRDLPPPTILAPGDLLVLNATRVLPARFRGVRLDTNGHAEGLYLGEEPRSAQGSDEPRVWRALLKMRRMRPGVIVALHDHAGADSGVHLELLERARSIGDAALGAASPQGDGETEGGEWRVRVTVEDTAASHDGTLLERVGLTPLPPYILSERKRRAVDVSDEADRARYQTVYAHDVPGVSSAEHPGSVAAPTAGMHFTPSLLQTLRERGVRTAEVCLHVGIGTFKPVESEFVEQHPMHAEWCQVSAATAAAILETRARGRRVIAVGTTSARTLESFASLEEMESIGPTGKWTQILITPGHQWRHIDGLMTNFHQPKSTLMAMVAALLSENTEAGVRRLKDIYARAAADQFRFYSYGDATLILP